MTVDSMVGVLEVLEEGIGWRKGALLSMPERIRKCTASVRMCTVSYPKCSVNSVKRLFEGESLRSLGPSLQLVRVSSRNPGTRRDNVRLGAVLVHQKGSQLAFLLIVQPIRYNRSWRARARRDTYTTPAPPGDRCTRNRFCLG